MMLTGLDVGIDLDEMSVDKDLATLKAGIKNIDTAEQSEKYVGPGTIINAIFEYFSREIDETNLGSKANKIKLSQAEKQQISDLLRNYLSVHHILVVGKDRKVKFVIDNKREFDRTIKEIVKIIINNKYSGDIMEEIKGETLKYLLNNVSISEILNEMAMEEYMDIVFGHIGGILKIILNKVNGTMTNAEYFKYFSDIYPNENKEKIVVILSGKTKSGQIVAGIDLKDAKYVGTNYRKK